MKYIIEQHTINGTTDFGFEPISEGEFDSREAAEAAMSELDAELGWTNLRVIESESD